MEPALARSIWQRIETLNAVTYFCAECREAPARRGLRGFWMGYFACRAAPLGAVGAGAVEATFFNFHPDRVRRAIPHAWAVADPKVLVAARAEAAASALRRLLGSDDAEQLSRSVLAVLQEAIAAGSDAGRPLYAANRDVPVPDDPVAALWQAATTLREHRGDSHVALLTGAGLDGCEAHVLFAASEGVSPELYLQSRGWSDTDWQAAVERLTSRGLLVRSGEPTERGRQAREGIERRTDELAIAPYAAVGGERIDQVLAELTAAAELIAGSGEIMFPNPMGLPKPSRRPER